MYSLRMGEKPSWPLKSALRGQRPNEVVHMNSLYIEKSTVQDFKYV